MIIILFCAILCWSGAGGPYILYGIEAIPPEPRQVFCHYGIQLERVMGRSAPVWRRCVRTLPSCVSAHLLCQGPSWIIKCVWSALPVPAESRKIARIFILWWSLFFSAPFFAGPVLEAHTSYTALKPSHQNHVRFSATMGYNWSVWWEEARRMCDAEQDLSPFQVMSWSFGHMWESGTASLPCFQDQWSGENLCSGFSGFWYVDTLPSCTSRRNLCRIPLDPACTSLR